MEWYEQKLRRNLVDMHIEDWDPAFLSKFDPQEYVRLLKLGNINAPMLYFQSHVGLCYWPTKSGRMHGGFAGREDAMRRVERACHEAGMSVIGYYSLIYNNWAYDAHPDWRMLDVHGKPSRASGGRYGLCCPNHGEYRAFVAEQIQELSEYFNFEGIFLDMTFWPMVCYCDQCRARWAREVGGELPEVLDWQDPAWLRFQEKRTQWLGDFALWATGVVEKHKPGCAVEHQYSPIMHYWRYGVSENITMASTYAGGDLYGGLAEQSFACKLYAGVTRAQPFEYMTSRCYPALSEHTTTKSEDLLRLSVMITYLHHGACLLIDAIDPVGTMDERVYERIGRVLREAEPYEPYLSWGKQAFDVALYYDLNAKYDPRQAPGRIGTGVEADKRMPMQEALLGAARALREHHVPYGVVNSWNPSGMRGAKVLVLSGVPALPKARQAEILDWVREGGRLYLSGEVPPAMLEEIFGLCPEGRTAEIVTYISPTAEGEALFGGHFTRDYPLVMFEPQTLVSGKPNGRVLGTLTLPYTLPNPGGNAQADPTAPPPRFASIHSNPPGVFTERPALVHAPYGKGEAVWCAAPIEKANREQHADIFVNLMTVLCDGGFAFGADAPASVECLLFDAPEHRAKLMGLINLQEGFRSQPVYDLDIRIRCDQRPKAALMLPDRKPLAFQWKDGQATVHLDKLFQCALYMLEF